MKACACFRWCMAKALLVLLLSSSLLARSASGHALDLATARITQRDEHVEILIETDVVQLVARSVPGARDATTIATADDATLASHIEQARRAIQAGASLEADGTSVPLVLRAFPTSSQLRFAAAEASASPGSHAGMSTLRFETTARLGRTRGLAVRLPSSLGRVLYTYLQPETRLSEPGALASFEVLTPPRSTPELTSAGGESHWRTWLALSAGLLAVVALALQLSRRTAVLPSRTQEPT